MRRAPGIVALVAGAVLAPSRGARADEAASPLRGSIICEAPQGPGRFRCDVEVRSPDAKLSWADVVVVKVDDFILPLRGRLGAHDASTREAGLYRWSLGFVAKGRGTGEVTLRVRAVLCRGDACDPAEVDVVGRVLVGR
jgi:hypothetical protein